MPPTSTSALSPSVSISAPDVLAFLLTHPFAVDFEQPRALWQKVFDDTQKEHFVGNVAGHLGGVKSPVVKARQRKSPPTNSMRLYRSHILLSVSVFAAVDQDLADRISKAIGHAPVKPLAVASASQAIRFQYNERPN